MEYSDLSITQLTAMANLFEQFEELMTDDLPDNFMDLLSDYVGMTDRERLAVRSEMSVMANFKAYVDIFGNGDEERSSDMASAMVKIVNDMSKMSKSDLKSIASNGTAKLAEISNSKIKG